MVECLPRFHHALDSDGSDARKGCGLMHANDNERPRGDREGLDYDMAVQLVLLAGVAAIFALAGIRLFTM